jgi:hypothetical protein
MDRELLMALFECEMEAALKHVRELPPGCIVEIAIGRWKSARLYPLQLIYRHAKNPRIDC